MAIFGSKEVKECPICGNNLFNDESFLHENGVEETVNSYCYNCTEVKEEVQAKDLKLIKEFGLYKIYEANYISYMVKDGCIVLVFSSEIQPENLLESLSNKGYLK